MSLIVTDRRDLTGEGHWCVESEDTLYRYAMGNRWAPGKLVAFIGINPSTMNADHEDATGRKWNGFAYRWGFGGWVAVNAFALRSRDPKALIDHADPIGADCDLNIRSLLKADNVQEIVVAWGNPPSVKMVPRLKAVTAILAEIGKPIRCVGRTTLGHPRHLVMEPYATRRESYP